MAFQFKSEQDYQNNIAVMAGRIREMRQISGFTAAEMAEKTDCTESEYLAYEEGKTDFPFSFLHKCALAFGINITDILEGKSARLNNYIVTRGGMGQTTVDENGILIQKLSGNFRDKIAEPYFVRYSYIPEQQSRPIPTTTHKGQEFDYVVSGKLKVRVGDHTEVLQPGDSIYYNSANPHGMIAVDGEDCVFVAVVLPGEDTEEKELSDTIVQAQATEPLLCEKFVKCETDEEGRLQNIRFEHEEKFNFGFDCIDAIGTAYPDKLAMLHIDENHVERRFTFGDMKKESARAANYFRSLGIRKGDRVMLVLRRHWPFWISMVALHKLGAVVIPATFQLKAHDFLYRFEKAGVKAILCTSYGDVSEQAEEAMKSFPVDIKIMVNGKKPGWRSFEEEYGLFSSKFDRTDDTPCGSDPAVMFFTSGTSGYPKMVLHAHTYVLGHFVTARYWHCVERDGLHLTISDTGWGKALWGKLYGQWLCESAVFVYDFDRFDAADIMPMFKKYGITTFCAPPTMLRMMVKEDLSGYDLSSIHHMTTAGEALNPEVAQQFEKATGVQVMEGFGQTETTLTIANLSGMAPRLGSMGKPSPQYNVDIVDPDGRSVPVGETGEIVIRYEEGKRPCGMALRYEGDPELTAEAWKDGMYHTGDTAWRDEDGYFWYVGRTDDVIKSSGYRIGPFEIENVIMELPYVLECGVSAAPDPIRGQVVKASIVLTKGTVPSEELKKEIQNYVKTHTAPYKYPRIVVFRDELPKSVSGKIQRNKL